MTATQTPVREVEATGRYAGIRARRERTHRIRSWVLTIALLLALVAAPLLVPSGLVSTLSRVLALGLLAVSLDLLTGVAGMPSLGHAAPFGVGAYAAGIVARDVSAFAPVPLLAAVLAGALFSALTGWLIVRSRGTYLLMLTLAVAELAHTLATRWDEVTGGSNGLVGIPAITLVPGGEPVRLVGIRYWWVLLVFLVGFAVIAWTARSNLGRSLRGLRDNEERMSSLGYSTFTLKYIVFCITGAVAGAAGAAWVATARFVSPADLGFEVSAMALLAIVVGGRGRLWGAVLGAALVTLVRDEIGVSLGGRGPLLLGLVFITVVYLLPRGFAGTPWRRLLQRQKES